MVLLTPSTSRRGRMAKQIDTCWTIVRGAARGDGDACSVFARDYLDVVRSFLGQRWARSPAAAQIDDAVQEVFLDLFRADGALQRLQLDGSTSFRHFLFGVVRNVALRYEERYVREQARRGDESIAGGKLPGDDTTNRTGKVCPGVHCQRDEVNRSG